MRSHGSGGSRGVGGQREGRSKEECLRDTGHEPWSARGFNEKRRPELIHEQRRRGSQRERDGDAGEGDGEREPRLYIRLGGMTVRGTRAMRCEGRPLSRT